MFSTLPDGLLWKFSAYLIDDLPAEFDQLGKFIKVHDFFICNRIEFGFGRKDEEGERFSNVLGRAGGGIIGDELIPIGIVELVEQAVVRILVLLGIDLLPFGVQVEPETVEKLVDVRGRVTAPFAGEISGARGEFALENLLVIGIVEDGKVWWDLGRVERQQMGKLVNQGKREG